jgi:hypothetical protein
MEGRRREGIRSAASFFELTSDHSLLPSVLCNLVADVTDTVSDMCNGAARTMDNVFAGSFGSVGDVSGRAASAQHQAARQDREH